MKKNLPLIALALLASPSLAFASFSYGTIAYTDIADTFAGSPYKQIVAFPAISNTGQVAFSVLNQSNVQFVYTTTATPGAFTSIADTAHGLTGMSSLTLNNNGVVAFSASNSNSPPYGIYAGNGGALTTVAASTTSQQPYYSLSTPRIADNGAVSFIGAVPTQSVVLSQSGAFSTVVQNNGSQFEYLFDTALNNPGQVAFNTDDYTGGNNNGAYVYRYTPGVGIVQISRAASSTTVAINDSGTLAFQASGGSGNNNPTLGIFSSNGTTTAHISDVHQNLPGTSILIDAYAANGEGTPINNAGLVAFQASDSTSANFGIYVGDGTNTTQILHRGQTLFGKTVNSFELGRDALNDVGQLTFSVTFTDNTSAVVRTTGTPEPASLSLLFPAAILLLKKRRR